MAGYDRPRGHSQHFGNTGMAKMGDIDNHTLRLHFPDNVSTKRSQSAFFQAMHRTRQFIVKEMGESGHTEAGIIQPVKIGRFTFQILEAFDREHRADRTQSCLPCGTQSVQVGG